MISSRTRDSLVQFLGLQEPELVRLLLRKHSDRHIPIEERGYLNSLLYALLDFKEDMLMSLLDEIAATSGDLRSRVTPKYRYNEREQDLMKCLRLDGYAIEDQKLIRLDPSIEGVTPVEDDLTSLLRSSGAPKADTIIGEINASADCFRKSQPDYNASLTHARIAFETLAKDIAEGISTLPQNAVHGKVPSWGSHIFKYLQTCQEITKEEKEGLSGVYGFLNPAAHRPLAIPEEEMARLGRSFALNMCWFLLKNHSRTR